MAHSPFPILDSVEPTTVAASISKVRQNRLAGRYDRQIVVEEQNWGRWTRR
jgi:hypothetical protein